MYRVAHPLSAVGDFAQGSAQQVVPQPPLDADGLRVGVGLVEGFQRGDVPLVGGTVRPEMLGNSVPIRGNVFQGHQSGIAEPFEQGQPSIRIVQGEKVGLGQPYLSGSRPAQQPPFAVGEDAHAYSPLGCRFGQVVVNLIDVGGIGFASAGGAYPALELDEGVQGCQIDGPAGGVRGRVFLDNFFAPGQAGQDEKVPDCASDVCLGLGVSMPPQNFPGGLGILGVGVVDMPGSVHAGPIA